MHAFFLLRIKMGYNPILGDCLIIRQAPDRVLKKPTIIVMGQSSDHYAQLQPKIAI